MLLYLVPDLVLWSHLWNTGAKVICRVLLYQSEEHNDASWTIETPQDG